MTGPRGQGRHAAAVALRNAAERFPDLDPVAVETGSLDDREARLAHAIVRNALQRWITIEFLLDQHLRRPMRRLEPALRGLLLTAGAQLLFMDRLPVHAIVDESVTLARKLVRPGAAGMVNAVLRRLAEQVVQMVHDQPWEPAPDRLPLDGGYVLLASACLPALATLDEHLATATSHPLPLVRRWIETHGPALATALCRHGVTTPPLFVSAGDDETCTVWEGSHAELLDWLKADSSRRVQDPTSALPVRATAQLRPAVIVDYCAGRGTKTRQVAALHPSARVVAWDADPRKLSQPVERPAPDTADLLMLDVPCSNTGVLSRRPEARYRFSDASLDSLVALQRRISAEALPVLRTGGHVLYSTCSVELEENQLQTKWMTDQLGMTLVRDNLTLPGGVGATFHDGGYWALLRLL